MYGGKDKNVTKQQKRPEKAVEVFLFSSTSICLDSCFEKINFRRKLFINLIQRYEKVSKEFLITKLGKYNIILWSILQYQIQLSQIGLQNKFVNIYLFETNQYVHNDVCSSEYFIINFKILLYIFKIYINK